MASSKIETIAKTYRTLASIPALVAAQLLGNGTVVNSIWSQRNLERGKITKFMTHHFLTADLKKSFDSTPLDITGELISSVSPSNKYRATIKDDDKDGHKQYLEIWSSNNLNRIIDLTALDLHGDVYTDVEFGVLKWSPDETKLLYVAEQKEPKSEPFLKMNFVATDEKPSEETSKGEQFTFKQDWGEQLVKKKQSVIVQFDLVNELFKIIEGIPEGLCPAQPTWAPNGTYIVGVAYNTVPRKLGLIYCTNRPSTIFILDFNQNYEEISNKSKSVKSPIFTPDGKTLLWLQRDSEGPHNTCMELVKINCPLKKNQIQIETVISAVDTEQIIKEGNKFYGLYGCSFPKQCWASERRLVFVTNQQNTSNTYILDIDSSELTELKYELGSQVVLNVVDDKILVNRRNYFVGDTLAIGKIPSKGNESSIVFEEITEPVKLDKYENFMYNYLNLKHNSNDDVDTFTAIYVGPKTGTEKEYPLIIWPHGGPHSSFTNNFLLEASLFLSFGFAILFVNYRGSVGTGQKSVDFLLGKIGESDVSDCYFATLEALKLYKWLDPNRVGLMGGSHGGFLVTHLSGQYPDTYQAVVSRNPVIDVAIQSITSDIPDWSFVECGFSYTQVGPLNNDEFLKMRQVSPIIHAHKVKAPTLLQVGSKDLRVPPSQGIEYYHRLKANGVTVKMNLYEDNHPLGNVPNENDNIINSLLWMQKYLNKP